MLSAMPENTKIPAALVIVLSLDSPSPSPAAARGFDIDRFAPRVLAFKGFGQSLLLTFEVWAYFL